MILGKLLPTGGGKDVKNGLLFYTDFSYNSKYVTQNLVTGTLTSGYFSNGALITGKLGQGFQIGSNTGVSSGKVPDVQFSSLDPFSMSFWVNSAASDFKIVRFLFANLSYIEITGTYLSPGYQIQVELRDATTSSAIWVWALQGVSLNAWHHWVVTFDGTWTSAGINFYRNGVFYPAYHQNQSVPAVSSSPHSTYYTRLFYANYSVVKTDEMGIWDRIIEPSEVAMIYNGGNGLSYSQF